MNRRILFSFLLLTCVLPLSARPVDPRIVVVAITPEDIAQYGGWPLARRWYAAFIQSANAAGARRIFIDIAFTTADPLHPESDEYLAETVRSSPNVFLLRPENEQGKGNVPFLGSRDLVNERTFLPFSHGVSFYGDRPLLIDTTTLAWMLSGPSLRSGVDRIVDAPAEDLVPDISFRTALSGTTSFLGKDIVLSLEYPGVTSYIVTSGGARLSTTMVQVWIASEIQKGRVDRLLRTWEYGIIAMVMLLPLVWFGRRRSFIAALITSTAAGAAGILLLILLSIIVPWWFVAGVTVLAVVTAVVMLISAVSRANRKDLESIVPPAAVPQNTSDGEVESLRYQLQYYENLSSQTVPDTENAAAGSDMIVHPTSPVAAILAKAVQVAASDLPVLILGESGTGKEKLAQFIHRRSARSDRPFVAVNCSSLNEGLIESELFGHEQGSFTGATRSKAGRFELANGGTLFLDEIGETSASFQTKILRVLQEHIVERVGGTTAITVDVRIIAATNRNLKELVKKGTFREDLYYRLHGFELELPPLRDRPGDVELLFRHFLYGLDPALTYSPHLLDWLKEQRWEGNVRQLQAAVQRSVLNARLHQRSFIIPKDLEVGNGSAGPSDDAAVIAEKILQGLRTHRFDHRSIAKVSAELGLHRSTVTEYFRGWIVRSMVKHGTDMTAVMNTMLGGTEPENREQCAERIATYIDAVRTSIGEGERSGENAEQILAARFRKLPVPFRDDLVQLIGVRNSDIRR